ncbi:hypothetical protein HD806DRAFT_495616 [Xylariaceae sp. AK1471]|nr:hypothetical protein HD806DRAFT_495616 [Xylariaceae sp. AK1471]
MAATEVQARPAWSSADDESLCLILDLLREDVRQMASNSKGKQREGVLSDAELALQLYTEDLNQATIYATDRRMTRSIQEAVQADAHILTLSEREERVAGYDRDIATALFAGRALDSARESVNNGPSAAELEMVEKLTATFITGTEDEEIWTNTETSFTEPDEKPETSSWAAARKPHQRPCTACSDMKNLTDLARAPCGHEYCRECLEHLFRDAIVDESLFPPRCCRQAIPVNTNRLYLDGDLVQKFEEKAIELSTPNRTYCHHPPCSTFIPPAKVKDGVAHCPECENQTCVTCKGAAHKGDCPFDEGLQQVLQIANEEGWQRCPKCSTMIALSIGCFHMTCKCRAEFCYRCGTPWKNCACAHWDERRLLDRAAEIYDRGRNPRDENLDVAGVNPEPVAARRHTARQAGIGRIVENLRVNHECNHQQWRHLRGARRCEECRDMMPLFIYECEQCNIAACRRCKDNRL